MKHSLKHLFVLAAVAMLIPCGGSSWTQAQAAPLVVATSKYKVIDMSKIPLANGKTAAESLEAMLNEMAAQGWLFMAITGNLIIFTAA